jgi:hypothetical protein
MDGSEFTFDNLNTLCWAAGSISGSLPDAGYDNNLRGKNLFR